jgi:probable phosphoglycerate mutase
MGVPDDLPKLWFLRHGETHWNRQKRIQGQLESQLTEKGVRQAHMQARLIRPVLRQGPACFVSPLGRAQETARIALGDTRYKTDTRLAEAHAGRWQGLLRADVITDANNGLHQDINALELFLSAPEGEGFADLQARIVDFLKGLSGPSVIVGHGLWGQVLRGLVRGLPRAAMGGLSNEQGCIYLLDKGRETVLRECGQSA